MTNFNDQFIIASKKKSFDLVHRKILNYNIGCYNKAVEKGKKQFCNLPLARLRAATIKQRVLENLDKYLKEFESNFSARGGKVIWAVDADQANREIVEILHKFYVRKVVKSKSMVTEEIGLNDYLGKNGIEVFETDLGEFIVQISNDKPYHIVTPAMHMSAADVAKVFHEKHGMPENSSPADITAFVRKFLREKFLSADAGITGANFLISETGSVAITENEGNGLLCMSLPKIHIVIAGIEKVIPSNADLDLYWPLLATYGTGQNITAYNSVINGPRQRSEKDGPEHMYVILLDNGRSNLLSIAPLRKALSCIRCGSCLNACPVYSNIGGHAYGTVYQGPIGSVIMPHLKKFEDYNHLSFASSLCGKCTEVCPVNIDLHNLLLHNRYLAQRNGLKPKSENWAMKAYSIVMSKRKYLDWLKPEQKNKLLKIFMAKQWGKNKVLPTFSKKTFGQLYKQKPDKYFAG